MKKLISFQRITSWGFMLITITVRNAAVLGDMASTYTYPSYMAVQVIDIGDILTRVEVFVAINFITMGFIED